MPLLDHRTIATTLKGKLRTSGRRTVSYTDAAGVAQDALVLGQGTSSGLKLKLTHTKQILDNVPKATAVGSVSCYRAR
jgi:hypothetical protein